MCNDKQIEAKPCPFCGSSGDLVIYRVAEDAMGCHVKCTNCNARTDEFEDAYAPSADAIGAWNQRAEQAEPAPAEAEETYYTEGKDAQWFEDLTDEKFIWEAQKAAMDLCDMNVASVEDYIPFIAIISSAANRIERLTKEPAPAARSGAVKVIQEQLKEYADLMNVSADPIHRARMKEGRDCCSRILSVLEPAEPVTDAEPDFAASISSVISYESEDGAACGWRSCSGCHETNEGYETGYYPYSKVFGCHVGAGCSECGGLGVVWEYWDKSALEEMSREHTHPHESRLREALEKILACPAIADENHNDASWGCPETAAAISFARAALAQANGGANGDSRSAYENHEKQRYTIPDPADGNGGTGDG